MTETTITIIDGSGASRLFRFEQQSDGSMAPRHVSEVDGNPVSLVNGIPMPVSPLKTIGTDYSTNKSLLFIPSVGANFSTSGPFASYVLIKTIVAGTRQNIGIENISGAQIVVLRDDGTAAPGAAPNNATPIVLAGGTGLGTQGGSWYSTTFIGRLQIYAASSTAVVGILAD